MATIRVAPGKRERLVLVALGDVGLKARLLASRRLRERRWEHELRSDVGYSPDEKTKLSALLDAALLEGAAYEPSANRYRVPESAVREVLGEQA